MEQGKQTRWDAVVDEVFGIMRQAEGCDYIGEPVSQLQHALQAARLAAEAGSSSAMIIAALFHDVGHLCAPDEAARMDGYGIDGHHHIAAAWLKNKGFGDEVAALAAGHVDAKRYLVGKRPHYEAQLSDASRETLKRQGGAMAPSELVAFEEQRLFADMLRLRSFDDRAKRLDWQVPDLESYRNLVSEHLAAVNS